MAKKKTRNQARKANNRDAVFEPEFIEDLAWWVQTDYKTALKILNLVKAVLSDPSKRLGKPEPLKYLGSDVWSRRLTQEHRVVYLVGKEKIVFLQARYHY